MNIAINVTYRCQLHCRYCDRGCDVMQPEYSDISMTAIMRFCSQVKELRDRLRRQPYRGRRSIYMVRLTGGEPTLHPQFTEIMEAIHTYLVRSKIVRRARVCSNGINKDKDYQLPSRRWSWRFAPATVKHHCPFGLSPADVGMQGRYTGVSCRIQNRCGILFDFRGWHFCHSAPILGQWLDIETAHDEPVMQLDANICKHCIYSIRRPQIMQLSGRVKRGELTVPSESLRAGVTRSLTQIDVDTHEKGG